MDFRAKIDLCSTGQLERMFSRFFPIQAIDDQQKKTEFCHPLAADFALRLGDSVASPAQVQGYLLVHKQAPEEAMANLTIFKENLTSAQKPKPTPVL